VVPVVVSQKAKAADAPTACTTRTAVAATAAADAPTIADGRASHCIQSDKGTIRSISNLASFESPSFPVMNMLQSCIYF
jgi:hypothetical protein